MNQKRRMQEVEQKAAEEEAVVNRMRQEGLMECLRVANTQYKNPWARATIDLLMQHAHGYKNRFEKFEHQAELQRLYDGVKEAKNARKRASPDSDRTAFELGQEKFAKAAVSARKPVGAELGVDGRGETAVEVRMHIACSSRWKQILFFLHLAFILHYAD